MDTPGVRHHALAMDSEKDPAYLCDVFTPCMGYISDALDNCDDVSPVTCFSCLASTFDKEAQHMNLNAIEKLDEYALVDHMIDRDAMAPGYVS